MTQHGPEVWRVVGEHGGERLVTVELDHWYWHATCGETRGPACGWQSAAVVRCMAEMHAGVSEIVPPGGMTRAEAVDAAVKAERARIVALLPECDGVGHHNRTRGTPCGATATTVATWGRLDWRRNLCDACAATFRAETAASLDPLPWADVVRSCARESSP